MKYDTRDFGEIDINETEILTFVQPILGFEEYTRFAMLHDEDVGDSITWLQSLENKDVCFILVDPTPMSSVFQLKLPDAPLGEGDCLCWVICTLRGDVKKATVNLKSPIFVNPSNQTAAQIMLEQDYPIRAPLFERGE